MVAGLKQQFPKHSAMQIRDLLIKSASNYETPDNKIGYGIPSYRKILELSKVVLATENDLEETVVFPNPISHNQDFKIIINGIEVSDNQLLDLFELNGRRALGVKISVAELRNRLPKLDSGTYVIKLQIASSTYTRKLIKL
jgi:hypothetical protein